MVVYLAELLAVKRVAEKVEQLVVCLAENLVGYSVVYLVENLAGD
jgi:hypothetical protein